MKGITLFQTTAHNNYIFSKNQRYFVLCHPLLRYIIEQVEEKQDNLSNLLSSKTFTIEGKQYKKFD
jgi:hypothetical protein